MDWTGQRWLRALFGLPDNTALGPKSKKPRGSLQDLLSGDLDLCEWLFFWVFCPVLGQYWTSLETLLLSVQPLMCFCLWLSLGWLSWSSMVKSSLHVCTDMAGLTQPPSKRHKWFWKDVPTLSAQDDHLLRYSLACSGDLWICCIICLTFKVKLIIRVSFFFFLINGKHSKSLRGMIHMDSKVICT